MIKEDVPWLKLVHCFNHCLELATKDAFSGTFFDKIDVMLRKIYYLYKYIPKRLCDLMEFGAIFEKIVQKPSKSMWTRWITQKVRAKQIIPACYIIFMLQIESLSQTESQALRRAEIERLAKKYLIYPVHLVRFLDFLTPIKVLRLKTQQEVHDPTNMIKRINEFSWTMAKLKILTGVHLMKVVKDLPIFPKFLKEVTLTLLLSKTIKKI